MNPFTIDKLSNNIKVITRQNPNTPRVSINLYIASGSKYDKIPGTSNMLSRLLLQGTTSRSAEEIANELDSNAIELGVESKQDYLRARVMFLNEDFDKALELFEDVMKNSTFENLDKEAQKFTGEIKLELDSPKTQAFDNLIRAIFNDHPYGNSHTKILNSLPSIKKSDVADYYANTSFIPEQMTFVVVGDINREQILKVLEEKFGTIQPKQTPEIQISSLEIPENKCVTVSLEDSSQAQIVQGWICSGIRDEDYPALVVLNTILGASGLSSRLFVELRDKKGLAYHVRSSLEALKHLGLFTVYIGTAPQNIKTCIEGFETEINKLKNETVSEQELNDAKNNYLGKRDFVHETNAQQAYYLGYYDIMGMGAEFDTEFEKKIRQVSSDDIKRVANKFLNKHSVISILAEEQFLAGIR